MATPMQCAPVEHAEEMENDGPCILKEVDSTADTVEPIERVTRYGPTLLGQRGACDLTASTVSTTSTSEVPPCPRIEAQRGFSW